MLTSGAAHLGAALLFVATALPAAAQQAVVLTSQDGATRIEGDLLGYDGSYYRVDTEFGALTVDSAKVDCAGPGCPDLSTFVPTARFSGAPEIGQVLLPALVEAFAGRRGLVPHRVIGSDSAFSYHLHTVKDGIDGPDQLVLDFRLTSSDEGFADLLANEADFALSLRPPTADEVQRGREAGLGDLRGPVQSQVLALDALVPVVARSNPLTSIPLERLRDVVAGRITRWSGLGGPDAPITLHLSPGDDAVAGLLGPVGAGIARDGSAEALAEAVAADGTALGLTRYSDSGSARVLPLLGSCGYAANPGTATLKTEDYPLAAPLLLYRPARHRPDILNDFLAFLLSPAAQPVIRRAGFVDQGIYGLGIELQGRRLAQAVLQAGDEISLGALKSLSRRMLRADRLTPTFRFEDGSTDLDAQSRSSVLLLAQALESGAYDGSRILFVGFSDGNGPAAANLRLARERAETVKDAVLRAAPRLDPTAVTISVDSYGEALPILCDADPWGAEINRRVEVWRLPGPPPDSQ